MMNKSGIKAGAMSDSGFETKFGARDGTTTPRITIGSNELASMTRRDEPRCRKNSFHSFHTIVRTSSIIATLFLLHQRQEHVFERGMVSSYLFDFSACGHQHRHERRHRCTFC